MASKTGLSNSKSQSSSGRTCLCSPTTHPGSFRCNLHRRRRRVPARSFIAAVSTGRWELAMVPKANAFKAFLLQIIKPSSNGFQRRRNFLPKPSRFCIMNNHGQGMAVS